MTDNEGKTLEETAQKSANTESKSTTESTNDTNQIRQKVQELVHVEKQDILKAVQELLKEAVGSVSSSCRIISLKQMLLTTSEKYKLSRNIFVIACLCASLVILSNITTITLKVVAEAICFIISSMIANYLTQRKGISLKFLKPDKQSPSVKLPDDQNIYL